MKATNRIYINEFCEDETKTLSYRTEDELKTCFNDTPTIYGLPCMYHSRHDGIMNPVR